MLARVERRLHDTSFRRRADEQDALGALGFEQQLERGVVEGGVAMLEQDMVALRATNTRGETEESAIEAEPEASLAA